MLQHIRETIKWKQGEAKLKRKSSNMIITVMSMVLVGT